MGLIAWIKKFLGRAPVGPDGSPATREVNTREKTPRTGHTQPPTLIAYSNGVPVDELEVGATYSLGTLRECLDARLATLTESQRDIQLRVLDAPVTDSLRQKINEFGVGLSSSLAQYAPSIYGAVQGGRLVQIVGSPELLQGWANGTLEVVRNTGGQTGLLREVAGGKFAGLVNFKEAGWTGALTTGGPLFVFQTMSFFTGQYYFKRIDSQLKDARSHLSRIEAHQRFQAIASLYALRTEAQRLAEELRFVCLDTVGQQASSNVLMQELANRTARLTVDIDEGIGASKLWLHRFEHTIELLQKCHVDGEARKREEVVKLIAQDLPRYLEEFSLADSWSELGAVVQDIGRVQDGLVGSARQLLRAARYRQYLDNRDALARLASSALGKFQTVASERAAEHQHGIKWFVSLFSDGERKAAEALCDKLDSIRAGVEHGRSRLHTVQVSIVGIDGQMFAVAEEPSAAVAASGETQET